MGFFDRLWRWLRLPRSFESVARELAEGLENGTIVLRRPVEADASENTETLLQTSPPSPAETSNEPHEVGPDTNSSPNHEEANQKLVDEQHSPQP